MQVLKCGAILLALLTLGVGGAAMENKGEKKALPKEIVIYIVGKGPKGKYVKAGDTTQKDVTVIVGQTVKWVNKGNRPHTATSKKTKEGGKPLFTTKEIKPAKGDKYDSDSITFDEKMFKAAGGTPGGSVTLEYYCNIPHPMKSRIILKAAERKKDE